MEVGALDVAVIGQVARDLALRVERLPDAGAAAAVGERVEALGGKGANQAVGMAQLGLAPALVGVVGDDRWGAEVVAQAEADRIDTRAVVRREHTRTGLIVDVVDRDGHWRYLQDIPPDVLIRTPDVDAAAAVLAAAVVVVVQLQQPLAAVCRAAEHGRRGGATVVLDGAPPEPSARGELLACTDVLRADDKEAELWADAEVGSAGDAVRVARSLLDRGPRMVVLGAGSDGNVVAWPGGQAVIPLGDVEVVDTTGAGDAFVAGIVAALDRGPEIAARWGSVAAGLTVQHLGGRPRLTRDAVERAAAP